MYCEITHTDITQYSSTVYNNYGDNRILKWCPIHKV